MTDWVGNTVLAFAVFLMAYMLSSFAWLGQRECVQRAAWNIDGGSTLQASGTYCSEWRDTWWPQWVPALGRQ